MKTPQNLTFEIKHIRNPISEESEDWKMTADQWLVTFRHKNGFFSIDYFTGSGHRKKLRYGDSRPVTPKIEDVLFSMCLDATAGDMNFHEWCMDYGYSEDSISALNTYQACLETAVNLRKLGLTEEYKQWLIENT
jgi:hypothetical protein